MPSLEAQITEVHRAVEQAARDSYGRLLAFLIARPRDVAAAEDALADAFHAALETWPRTGVPEKPEAWLLVASHRRLIDAARHVRVHLDGAPSLLAATEQAREMADIGVVFPDEHLKVMFACTHPAIDAAARAPLMLQTVLGLDAARVASAFWCGPRQWARGSAARKLRSAPQAFALHCPKSKSSPSALTPFWKRSTRPTAAAGKTWRELTLAAKDWLLKPPPWDDCWRSSCPRNRKYWDSSR